MLAVKLGSEQDVTRGGGNGSGCSGTRHAVMNSALCARKKTKPSSPLREGLQADKSVDTVSWKPSGPGVCAWPWFYSAGN